MLVQCTNPHPIHSRQVVIPSPPPFPHFFFCFFLLSLSLHSSTLSLYINIFILHCTNRLFTAGTKYGVTLHKYILQSCAMPTKQDALTTNTL